MPPDYSRFPYLLTDEPKDFDAEYERMIEKEEMKADERRDDERKETI